MIGFDDIAAQEKVLLEDRQDVSDCLSRTIANVMFTPPYSTLELAARPQNLKCGAPSDLLEVPGNPLRFYNNNGNNGIANPIIEGVAECTSDFLVSSECILVQSEVKLESLVSINEQSISDAIYDAMSKAMENEFSFNI